MFKYPHLPDNVTALNRFVLLPTEIVQILILLSVDQYNNNNNNSIGTNNNNYNSNDTSNNDYNCFAARQGHLVVSSWLLLFLLFFISVFFFLFEKWNKRNNFKLRFGVLIMKFMSFFVFCIWIFDCHVFIAFFCGIFYCSVGCIFNFNCHWINTNVIYFRQDMLVFKFLRKQKQQKIIK